MSGINFVSDKKNVNKLWWKHIYRINSSMKKSCDFALWEGITWLTSGPISFIASICCYGYSKIPEQSLSSKYFCVFLHDCVPKQQHPPPKAMTAFTVFRLLVLRCKRFFIFADYYIQWLLLVFLVLFSASLPGSDHFVLFDLDGNGALFENVLCDIPFLRINLIWIFGWKLIYCLALHNF